MKFKGVSILSAECECVKGAQKNTVFCFTVTHVHALLKQHRCSVAGLPVIRSPVNDHEIIENIYSDKKDMISKKKTNKLNKSEKLK